jgi:exopolysaccharide biosynthesis operon protein EpsL
VAAALGLLPCVARADAGDVINYSLGASVKRDDNLFRLAPGVDPRTAIGSSDASDTLTSTSVAVVADKQIGIQRLKMDMSFANTRYSQFRRLDNESYDVSGNWAWAVGQRLHGDLSAARKTALSSFDQIATTDRNINTVTSHSASVYLQVMPDWELFGVFGNTDSADSAAANQAASYSNRSTDTGIRYRARAGHQMTLLQRQVRSARVREEAVDASATWVYSPITQVSAGLGRVRRQVEGGAEADSSAATGNFAVGWVLSPKTQFNLAARQAVSAAASNYSTSTLVRSVTLGAGWATTAKTSLQVALDRSITRYTNDPAAIFSAREDRVHGSGLSLSYQPDRSLSLSLSLRAEARDSNQAAFAYRARMATVSAHFTF